MSETLYRIESHNLLTDQESGRVKAEMHFVYHDCDYRNVVLIENQMKKMVDGLFELGDAKVASVTTPDPL